MPTAEVLARLGELQPVYQVVRQLWARQDELRTVEQARGAYEALVVEEARTLDRLQQRKAALELSWRRRSRERAMDGPALRPWELTPGPTDPLAPAIRPSPPRSLGPARSSANQKLRRRLTLMVNRHQFLWVLEPAVLAQVNQIAEDGDRPLGEALAHLPWRAFAEPAGESDQEHLGRLADWAEALATYRQRLEADVEVLETRFRDWLGIWQLWREREHDEVSAARWDSFIAGKRRALASQVDRLRGEIADLEVRDRADEGQP